MSLTERHLRMCWAEKPPRGIRCCNTVARDDELGLCRECIDRLVETTP